jgi:ribosomal 50S subunit-recycling heat shock protein
VSEKLRVDVLLDRLCLTRSRSEAKAACDAGVVHLGGAPAKASQMVGVGDVITLRFPHRLLEVELEQMPAKSTSKKAARELYRVIRDEKVQTW